METILSFVAVVPMKAIVLFATTSILRDFHQSRLMMVSLILNLHKDLGARSEQGDAGVEETR